MVVSVIGAELKLPHGDQGCNLIMLYFTVDSCNFLPVAHGSMQLYEQDLSLPATTYVKCNR